MSDISSDEEEDLEHIIQVLSLSFSLSLSLALALSLSRSLSLTHLDAEISWHNP